MTRCGHVNLKCLNHFEAIRKYQCLDCGEVLICDCERALALRFLPHQLNFGTEYGTRRMIPVDGFEAKVCTECRGGHEEAHPLAVIYGRKGKVERFYWREIKKTYFELASSWLDETGNSISDILQFERSYPDQTKSFKAKSKKHWQIVHQKSPKYDVHERTEAEFFNVVSVPIREIDAEYVQVKRGDQQIGRWISPKGERVSAEDLAREWYAALGFGVVRCERQMISTWVATFVSEAIQDPADPRISRVSRHSTRGWSSKVRNTPIIEFLLPDDFGSAEFYERRRTNIDQSIDRMRGSADLVSLYDQLLEGSWQLRDYLWVNDNESVKVGHLGVSIIPAAIVIEAVQWAIKDFWNRQPGWPDLFIYRDLEYMFCEVKSPHDRLSADQMNWLEWAVNAVGLHCEICRIKKR